MLEVCQKGYFMPKKKETNPTLDRQRAEPASTCKGGPQEATNRTQGGEAAGQLVILDNVPAAQAALGLSSGDLKRLRSLHAVFDIGHSEAWIEMIRAKINNELEWE